MLRTTTTVCGSLVHPLLDLHRLKSLLREPCRWPKGAMSVSGALTSVMLCGTLLGSERYQTVAHTRVSRKPSPVLKLVRVSVRQ
jgi:hypothetical protein